MVGDQPQPTVEEKIRSSLRDVVAVAEKLAPICLTVEDLVGICKLALKNDGQLLMVMERLKPE